MRKIQVDGDVYHKGKRKFKKFIKEDLGFEWTGYFNPDNVEDSLIEWRSDSTEIVSKPVLHTITGERLHNIFTIDGVDEDKVADYLTTNLQGVDISSDEDFVS